jgi:predicted ATPase with chaperone activity
MCVLEGLSQGLEDKVVTISRAQGSLFFPINFQLVAAMDPFNKNRAAGRKIHFRIKAAALYSNLRIPCRNRIFGC